jgi:hypothetical protein
MGTFRALKAKERPSLRRSVAASYRNSGETQGLAEKSYLLWPEITVQVLSLEIGAHSSMETASPVLY